MAPIESDELLLGCANLFNKLAIYQKLLKALCSNCAPQGLEKWHQPEKEDTAGNDAAPVGLANNPASGW